jgi:hypothetical protein
VAERRDVPEQVEGRMSGAWSIRFCVHRSDDTEVDPSEAKSVDQTEARCAKLTRIVLEVESHANR